MNSDVFIAYLGILGFKELINNNSHEELVGKYEELFDPNIEYRLSKDPFDVIEIKRAQLAIADRKATAIRSLTVSDSIILWTKDASMKSFIEILVATQKILLRGILVGMPLRGTISLGPVSRLSYGVNSETDNAVETVVGEGIMNAHKAASSQQWSGCVVSDVAVARYTKNFQQLVEHNKQLGSISYLVEKGLIVNYPVPIHLDHKRQTVVNWPRANKIAPTEEMVRDSFSKHNKSVTHPPVELKVYNTVRFLHDMLK